MDKRDSFVRKWVKALKWMMSGPRSDQDRRDFEALTETFDREIAGWWDVENSVKFHMFAEGIGK